jgi:hypothetical protein
MNFLQAKNIVSPDKPVVPGSPEHKEILTLMRQSGRIFPEDNVPAPPLVARVVRDFYPRERAYVDIQPKPVSKREWLMVKTNRDAMNKVITQEVIAEPVEVYEFPSTLPTPGMSKKEWLRNLKITPLIISDGTDVRREQVQATGET